MDKPTPALLPRIVGVLEAVSLGATTAGEVSRRTGLPRATAYRLLSDLAREGLLARTADGRYAPGSRLAELAGVDHLAARAPEVLAALGAATGQSAQLYRRRGDVRVAVATVQPTAGLHDVVPLGAHLPLTAGSAAHVLLAWAAPEIVERTLPNARFTRRTLELTRRRGWSSSTAEREPGVASVSAPVRDAHGTVVAAVSVSGPAARLSARHAPGVAAHVLAAAAQLSEATPTGDPASPR